MTGVQLLGLLLLKHGLLAHLVDFGYSASRRQQNKFWYLGLLFHSLAELAGTMYVLSQFSLEAVVLVLLIELAGVVTTTLFEREAPLRKMLGRHIVCELGMVVVYVLVTSFLVWC